MSSLSHQPINKQKGTTMFTARLATPQEVAEFGTHAYPSENWVVEGFEGTMFPSEASAIAFVMGEE
jgi:hypothetical protein